MINSQISNIDTFYASVASNKLESYQTIKVVHITRGNIPVTSAMVSMLSTAVVELDKYER